MEFKFEIDPLTKMKVAVMVNKTTVEDLSKEIVKKINALKRPCECGSEMQFDSFCCNKAKSVSFSGEIAQGYVGKFQCQKCGKRYYITEEQMK